MDSVEENYLEKWNAVKNEYMAKADRLDAEKRLEFNNVMNDFNEEVSAGADWTEATWKEFVAKVDKKWQEFAIYLQESNN